MSDIRRVGEFSSHHPNAALLGIASVVLEWAAEQVDLFDHMSDDLAVVRWLEDLSDKVWRDNETQQNFLSFWESPS